MNNIYDTAGFIATIAAAMAFLANDYLTMAVAGVVAFTCLRPVDHEVA